MKIVIKKDGIVIGELVKLQTLNASEVMSKLKDEDDEVYEGFCEFIESLDPTLEPAGLDPRSDDEREVEIWTEGDESLTISLEK